MSIIPGYMRHFKTCNAHDITKFLPLSMGPKNYGFVTQEIAALLSSRFDFFKAGSEAAFLAFPDDTFQTRSRLLGEAVNLLAEHFKKQLRSEMYPVIENFGDEPVAEIDRAAVPWFGVKAWGVHVNGFTHKDDGIHLWVGKRAANRIADPGKLDNMIGGGHPIGLTLEDNLCKEAQEEAGISRNTALGARQVNQIRYRVERNNGLSQDTLFVYDLELPSNFVPVNTDGEVESFELMSVAQVAEIVRTTDEFKFNCNLVIIDFLVRHGTIGASCPEYSEILNALHPKPSAP